MTDLNDICEITVDFRRMWENILESTLNRRETAGSCLFAAMLLSSSLEKFSGVSTLVCGGDGQFGGLRGRDGELHGHYWVEGQTATGQHFVADVTADQFGYDSVVVLPLEAARAVYLPGDQAIVDQHVMQESALCTAAVTEPD